MNNLPAINGLILAGGKSSRMGKDKSLISFHEKPQREFLSELLSAFCKKVFLSCKKNELDVPVNLNPIKDNYAIESPLNGILSAFDYDATAAWLTVPVDMPWINSQTITYLISNREENKIATCFFDSEGKNPEPLLTIWEPACYRLLKDFYVSGKISPRDFLKQSNVKLLHIPDQKMLININSEDELKNFFSKKGPNQ